MKTILSILTSILTAFLTREAQMRTPELCRAIIRLACRAFPKGRHKQAEREYWGDLERETGDKAELSQIAFALNVLLFTAPKAAAASTFGWSAVGRAMTAVQISGAVMFVSGVVSTLLMRSGIVNPVVLSIVRLGGYGYAAATLCFVVFLWRVITALTEEGSNARWHFSIKVALYSQVIFWGIFALSLMRTAVQNQYFLSSLFYALTKQPLQALFGPLLAPDPGLTGLLSALGLVQAFLGMGVYLTCTFMLERKLKQFAQITAE